VRPRVRSLQAEEGQALIEGLLALGLVLLVVVVAVQALAYAHARSVAAAAAQDGARTAAVGGADAGVARADGASLHATARVDVDEVTVRITGSAPRLFPLSLVLPNVVASASLPLERYPQAEAAP
jgi:uncharacterized membrane protein